MQSITRVGGIGVPIGIKSGIGAVIGMAVMYSQGDAIGDDLVKSVQDWRSGIEEHDDGKIWIAESQMAQGFSNQNGGPVAAKVLTEITGARKKALQRE